MPAERVCTECGGSLAGRSPSSYTCSNACRKKRERRRRKEKAEGREATVGQLVNRRAEDVAHDVLKEELRPIVRGAITEDVLRAVNRMVKLTPRAVEVLGEQMDSGDAVLEGRAAALVVKYTVGHPALVRPEEESPQAMQVIFQLPRPDQPAPAIPIESETDDEEDTENRVCDICHETKSLAEFEGDSDRCSKCFREWREQILHRMQ